MLAQISAFFDHIFPKYQCRFCHKGYQHCHLKILEKLNKCVGKEKFFMLINRPLKDI